MFLSPSLFALFLSSYGCSVDDEVSAEKGESESGDTGSEQMEGAVPSSEGSRTSSDDTNRDSGLSPDEPIEEDSDSGEPNSSGTSASSSEDDGSENLTTGSVDDGDPMPGDGSEENSVGDDDEGIRFDIPGAEEEEESGESGESGMEEEEVCDSVSLSSEPELLPVDIIFVVDTSGSMGKESDDVQANLNDFSERLSSSGLDARLMMYSSREICIEPPLGSGSCPESDTNPPNYFHPPVTIRSADALEKIMCFHSDQPEFDTREGSKEKLCGEDIYSHYTKDLNKKSPDEEQYPDGEWLWWGDKLREGANLHFVVISDDNSSADPSIDFFQNRLIELGVSDYRFHGVVSERNCATAAEVGKNYIELAERTGGRISDLCKQDFELVFEELTAEVTKLTVPCEFDIPESPEGATFDFEASSVFRKLGDEERDELDQVDDPLSCGEGWYFDNNDEPKKIHMCPDTCADLNRSEVAVTVEAEFPCIPDPVE